LVLINVAEGAAYGAALLAGVGSGVYGSVEEAAGRVIRVTSRTAPTAATSVYDAGYPIYRSLYPALQPSFNAISDFVTHTM
jgi:xylulokinase